MLILRKQKNFFRGVTIRQGHKKIEYGNLNKDINQKKNYRNPPSYQTPGYPKFEFFKILLFFRNLDVRIVIFNMIKYE